MNNKIKLAVAGAVLSAASVANAGIVIPAGDWTLDVNGNVNIFATMTKTDDTDTVTGGVAAVEDSAGEGTAFSMGTGLLPAWLGFTGTTRQNDLDVSFTISIQPNTSDNSATGDATNSATSQLLTRQAFITFGDASWGSVKMGKDLGIFASDAIVNDITLLGVGAAPTGGITTLGGIGNGYLYAGFRGQIAYTTPNMNGLQVTLGITNPDQGQSATGLANYDDRFGLEGKAVYTMGAGKLWAGFSSYEVANTVGDYDATAGEIGAQFNAGNLQVTAYYYSGEGNGDGLGLNRLSEKATAAANNRDNDGGYLQATYVIPSGTKLGVAVATSQQDLASGETAGGTAAHDSNDRWTVGAYHPLTKHLNLVAEYNDIESDDHEGNSAESQSINLGAILFF
jgi:predicted porin